MLKGQLQQEPEVTGLSLSGQNWQVQRMKNKNLLKEVLTGLTVGQ